MESPDLIILWMLTTWLVVNFVSSFMEKYREAMDEVRQELHDRIDALVHIVEVEQHKETLYWFDKDNGKFLAQGRTTGEIVAVLKDRFPNHMFYLNEDDKELVMSQGTGWKAVAVDFSKLGK